MYTRIGYANSIKLDYYLFVLHCRIIKTREEKYS